MALKMIGIHLLADFYGVAAARLCDAGMLGDCLLAAAARCHLTPLSPPVLHPFPGGGVTGFVPLSESHIALHTYPENGFMALDIFSCGSGDIQDALQIFRAALGPDDVQVTLIERGSVKTLLLGEVADAGN